MEEQNKGGDPSNSNAADASATVNSGTVKPDTTVPKSRFDEVYEDLKAEKERARIYKEALDQTKSSTEEEKKLREQAEARVGEIQQAAWKANALRAVAPQAAEMIDGLGAQFEGNSQEEYVTWAKTLEAKILPKLSSKNSVDGNRATDEPTEITPELIKSWPAAKQVEYLRKTLPRVEHQY